MTDYWPHPEPHPGAYLKERFLDPLGISISALARAIGVPKSRISEIVNGRRQISADTAARLGAHFDIEAAALLELQGSFDLSRVEIPEIERAAPPPDGMVTPIGFVRFPKATRPTGPITLTYDTDTREDIHRTAQRRPPLLAAEPELVRYPSGVMAWESRARRGDADPE